MKRTLLIVAALLLGITVLAMAAPAPYTVLCQGNICGGGGSRNYQYDISMDSLIYQFHVGTCDPNPANYTNILMPAGWSFGIYNILEDHADTFTPHGMISTPTGKCQWCVVWTDTAGQGLSNVVLGYDNPNEPHDVGWFINSTNPVENWAMPVGAGSGPVHGPMVPEPSGVIALASGFFALTGAFIRKRR